MGRRSNVHRVVVQGHKELHDAMLAMGTTVLKEIVEDVMTKAMEPVRLAVIQQFANHPGKHDEDTATKAGRWNRWRWKNHKEGKSVGFSRAQVKRAFTIPGFGFSFWVDKKGNYRSRVKSWAPGIHIIDAGRYMGTAWYSGWRIIKTLYKSMVPQIDGYVRSEIPRRIMHEAKQRGLA